MATLPKPVEKGKLSGISYLIYHRLIVPGCMLRLVKNGITSKPEIAFTFLEEWFCKEYRQGNFNCLSTGNPDSNDITAILT